MSVEVTVRPLNPIGWLGAPVLACAAATLILALPLRVAGLQLPEPVFGLILAFAWAMIRPSFLPPFALVGLGLFMDLIWGDPIGLWPLCLLAAYGPVMLGRRYLAGQGFGILWAWFGAVCAGAFAVGWILTTLMAGAAPGLIGVFWQYLVTVALFPVAYRLIERYEDADVRFR